MTWPKTIEVAIGSDKEQMWDEAEKLGLEGEAVKKFKYALADVQVTISVNQDGSYRIVSVRE